MMLAPHSFIRRAISSALVPSAIRCASSRETEAITGMRPSVAATAASIATRTSAVWRMVSTTSPSTPAATSARAWAPRAAFTLARSSGLASPRKYPLGPMAPVTYARPCAARRATRTPASQISSTCALSPYFSSRSAFAPKVFVSITCAPGAEVVLVDLEDQLGTRDIQLLEASTVENAALVKLRPHRAIDDEGSGKDGIEKRAFGLGGGHTLSSAPSATA